MGVRTVAVDLATFVVLGEMLGDGKTFRIAEEQSMAIFPLLHLVAGADPGALFDLLDLVIIEIAGAERAAKVVDVLGEANDEKLGDVLLGMEVGAALFDVFVDELPHLGERLLAGLGTIPFVDMLNVGHGMFPQLRR
jgi:hypothetical protein